MLDISLSKNEPFRSSSYNSYYIKHMCERPDQVISWVI